MAGKNTTTTTGGGGTDPRDAEEKMVDAGTALPRTIEVTGSDYEFRNPDAEGLADRIAGRNDSVADALRDSPALATNERIVTLRRTESVPRGMDDLWWAISVHSEAISFRRYASFLDDVCTSLVRPDPRGHGGTPRLASQIPGVDLYGFLKTATEAFLLLNCGITPMPAGEGGDDSTFTFHLDPQAHADLAARKGPGTTLDHAATQARLNDFLRSSSNNYLELVIRGAFSGGQVMAPSHFCLALDAVPLDAPCLMELIWSYWMEEGMLNQTIAAITRRFQNVRRAGRGPDPLAELELDPLRPLNAFLWGYLQDEPNRLSVVRRAYEYNHHYGLTLYGRAVPPLRPADPRSRFLEGFHNLLRQAAAFYKEDNDTTVIADAFPVLNSLREVHLLLSEGAHNQFRDLPWQSRVEMLMQQWLLARPEMREFIRGRYMVSYPEEWMGPVDSMKRLQGWTDTSVLHFRDLARSGERILLSIRYANWNEAEQDDARSWLRYWRDDVQRYIHAYYTATGVNLSDDVVEVRNRADARYLQPSYHLRNRLLSSQRAARQLR
jgi:hypothetical protein